MEAITVSEGPKTTIKVGDLVRVLGTRDQRTYEVASVVDGPAEVRRLGPFATFTRGGFWRVSGLEKVSAT